MHTLMAATDLSSRSGKALHQAMLIALQCEARLVILHVVDERQPTELADRRISEVKTFLNASAADIGRLNGLEVDVIVRCGIPHLVIAETAREQAVDPQAEEPGESDLEEFAAGDARRVPMRRGHEHVLGLEGRAGTIPPDGVVEPYFILSSTSGPDNRRRRSSRASRCASRVCCSSPS